MIMFTIFLLITALLGLWFAAFLFVSKLPKPPADRFKTLVFLGSGGHTTEMLRLLSGMDKEYFSPRIYVSSSTDLMSETHARAAEREYAIHHRTTTSSEVVFKRIARSREVKQSWISTIFSSLRTVCEVTPLLLRTQPQLILCNGPGTCVILCLVAAVLDCLFLCQARLVYVESICRVTHLSLSARILRPVVDSMLVQWKGLADAKAKYIGRLV
eukprot:m.81124 g.81124  ORF g.81124 m.81124 type:complete len:214 (+) comp13354_c0_seq2:14-655(+)